MGSRASLQLRRRVGSNAKRLRLVAGKTTADAAVELGVDERYLRRLEAGTFNLGLSSIEKVAKVYARDPVELLRPLRSPPSRKVGRPPKGKRPLR
ncbi:MAG: helix-turn-helix domain-containing protein [Deltaproteobacteria bacterium]